MRPDNLQTKIFLDSGDPGETRAVLLALGFLDGQTTNPSLVAKNPATAGKKFSQEELLRFYRGIVEEVSALIPQGSVSIEVYADPNTTTEEMLKQGREFYKWIPNAHIKYPTTTEGLKAAEISVKEGMRVNMTLVFSQEQAAAVYAATLGALRGQVFVSPFMGRHFDAGRNGIDLLKNVIKMYKQGDGHVMVLGASLRDVQQFYAAMQSGPDIITVNIKYLNKWKEENLKLPGEDFVYAPANLEPIVYKEIDLNKPWQDYNIHHELTGKGLEQFAKDWNNLIK